MQRSVFVGIPLAELLNSICNALDCEIGNVVSLVSILDDDTTDPAAIAGNATHFGLHMFCSMRVVSANRGPLGKLEVYSCEPGLPDRRELDIIKRAAWLAAIAIERENECREDDGGRKATTGESIAQPVTSSYPMRRASNTSAGMKGSVSSAIPIVPPPTEKASINTNKTHGPRPRPALTTAEMAASMAPVALITPNVPPIRKM
jgi:hypothetical protein